MSTRTVIGRVAIAAFAATLLALPGRAAADEHFEGVITVRADTTLTVMRDDASPVVVLLDEATKIEKPFAASDLIPGLKVKVAGEPGAEGRFLAHRITFNREEMEIARAILAGLTMTKQQVAENTANIQKGAVILQQHGQTLDTHGQTLDSHQNQITTNDQKMVATTGNITTRINDLDEYNAIDTLIVYFKNGRANVDKDSSAQLQEFAAKAKGYNGYKLQVKGYASAVGSRALNETLSAKRADAVTATLAQLGGIPPANIFVPAAMGVSEQFADNKTAAGQKENRRVVVTILQSKGLVDR
jgi:outer membrane protein OmpA-like peptidoglycan-associated protein